MIKYLLLPIVSLLLLSSCEMFHFHPYEEVIGCLSGLTELNKTKIENMSKMKDTLRIAFISDTQRYYDDTRSAINYINSLPGVDFMLHGGDLTDFGAADEYKWMYRELERINIPYLTVIGNHDFIGTGEKNYQTIYGAFNYSLNAGHLHLLCLNTASWKLESSLPVPDLGFIEDDLASVNFINQNQPDSLTHTIVMMHMSPGDSFFNNSQVSILQHYLSQFPGMGDDSEVFTLDLLDQVSNNVSSSGQLSLEDRDSLLGTHTRGFCLNGHNHSHRLSCSMGDKNLFFQVPDVHSRQLYIFTIHPQGYYYESVDF